MKQFAELDSPYGADLVFSQLSASEAISQPGCYRITALSPRADLDFNKALGAHVTVRMQGTPDHIQDAASVRCFDGLVEQIALVGHQGKLFKYQIVARSWLWFLSQTHDCKVFQNQTVIEILEEVFGDHPIAVVDKRTTADYTPWVYCVQYRESDFNFVSRLMEQEGIYYYFTHEPGKHSLVLADGASAHDMPPRCSALPVRGAEAAGRSLQECVWDVGSTRRMRPGKQVLKDYDFTRTQVNLTQTRAMPGEHALGDMEVFDYPGFYDKEGDGEQFVRAQMEHLAGGAGLLYGQSDARMLACGGLMRLTHALRASDNGEYLVTASQILVEQPDYESTGTSDHPGYGCRYQAVPSSVAYRAERATPKPFVQGPQTAVVVGPAGDEIYTDKYGRVKVQFHWDRYGKKNEKSSCWVRVSSPWAGKSFGFVQIPRIGQEVVVDFLEGDPDQPLITGRVYNAEQMPPWELPANATQSGVLSRSSKGGAYGNANALRFEDKKGAEQLWLHAEKDQLTEVEHDEDKWVGNDRRKNIDHDETSHIKHDRTETVDNNETITIGVNRSESVGNNETIKIGVNRTESVGANESITIGANRTISVGSSETASVALQRTHTVGVNETIAIGAAQEIAIGAAQVVAVGAAQTITVGVNQSTSVGANQSNDVGANQSTTVGAKQTTNVGADRSIQVGGAQSTQVGKARSTQVGEDDALKVGKNWVVDAGDSVTIKTGSASITMKKDGTITIKGKDITVDGSGKINIKASSDVVIKGSKIGAN